jgi:hypothetical protein
MENHKIQPFDCESKSFADFLDREENYFDLCNIQEEDKES